MMGPVHGVIELSASVKSLKGYRRWCVVSTAGIEFVFDPVSERLVFGKPKRHENVEGSGHVALANTINADHAVVLGGTIFATGDPNVIAINEWSGHYGKNWSDASREQLKTFIEKLGFKHELRPLF